MKIKRRYLISLFIFIATFHFAFLTPQSFTEPQFGHLITYLSHIVFLYLFVKIIGD